MTSNILVTGATGKTGRRVVDRLKKLNQNVRMGTRRNQPAFDWEQPDTWPGALEGMDKVYIVYYPDLAVPGAFEAIRGLMAAAKKAGVKKAVLLSGKGEKEAERCEQVVASSGLDYTLVRASWFNQNFSEGAFLDFVLAGQVALPMPEAEIPFVDADDIADVVTKVLLEESYNGKTITVTGPRKMTYREVVAAMAKGLGRDIEYVPISIAAFKGGMKAAGLPDSYVWLFGYLFEEVLGNPDNQEVSGDVEWLLGRPATDFTEYVERTVASGIWDQVLHRQ